MGPETCNSKEMKHTAINNSISYLKSQVKRLEDLVQRINNSPRAEKTEAVGESERPTLLNVLIESPKKIHSLSDKIGQCVDELDNLLF